MVGAHIKEYLKKTQVSEIDYQVIIVFRETLMYKELSNNYINKIMILIKKLLDIALRQGILNDNPCRLIRKLSVKQKK